MVVTVYFVPSSCLTLLVLCHRVPTYEEVVGGSDEESEDEKALESQEKFERRFNFRFEEPDGDLIASYPRTVMGSVRREDERRKTKRKQREERKAKVTLCSCGGVAATWHC